MRQGAAGSPQEEGEGSGQVTAQHHDSGKSPLHLLPPWALNEVAHAMGFGATKYAPWDFMKGMDWSRPYSSAQRHLSAWNAGENLNTESSLNHLAHAIANLLILLTFVLLNLGVDDRWKPGVSSKDSESAS